MSIENPEVQRRRSVDFRKGLIPASIAIGCLPWMILFLILVIVVARSPETGSRVGLINVSGVITAGGGGGGLLSDESAGSERIVKQLEEARRNKRIKAVVLRINSPGGSPAGSEEVYKEIKRLRAQGKRVFVSMGDLAASGGYYIAAAADKIYADQATLTGSIGVIYEGPELSQLLKKVGVNLNVITTGKFKDMGNPARPMTTEERSLIKGMITDTYDQFLEAVAQGRHMPIAKVRSLADGRVYTGRQAKKLGLIDEIGGLRETVLAAAKSAGIKGEPKVTEFRKGGLADAIFGTESSESSRTMSDTLRLQFVKFLLGTDNTYQSLR